MQKTVFRFQVLIVILSLIWSTLPTTSAQAQETWHEIDSAGELYDMRNDPAASYRLMADIDLSAYPNWTPIGTDAVRFTGKLDGNGKVIRNLVINNTSGAYQGLFGVLGGGSVVTNLALENANVTAGNNAGILAGANYGAVSTTSAKGVITGNDNVGGLVGDNHGQITNAYAAADVSGHDKVGGLVGLNSGSVTSSYAASTVSASLFTSYLQFDGTDDFVEIPHQSYYLTESFTLEAWFQWDETVNRSDVDFIIGKGFENFEIHTGGDSGANGIRFIPVYRPFTLYNDSRAYQDVYNVISDGWFHVAAVWDYSTLTARIYINGVPQTIYQAGVPVGTVASIPLSISENPYTDNVEPFTIGMRGGGGTFFKGKISDVRFWNIVRTPEQIDADKHKQLTGSESGLVGYWKLDEESGDSANDSTANHNDGIIYGATRVQAGTSNIGGLIGSNTGSVTSSYYDSDVDGLDVDSGEGNPRSTAQMKSESTFSGWNFSNVWKIQEGVTYPSFTRYTLTYTAGAHGSISGAGSQTVSYNGYGSSVTAVPDADYIFVDWSDGVTTAARQDGPISANFSASANFALSNRAPTNISLSNTSINENVVANSTVGTFFTTDQESATQTYIYTLVDPGGGCSGTDNASFNISGSLLRISSSFDYETKSSYTICVRTTDNGNPVGSFDKQFTITVNDVNEAPTAISLTNNRVDEEQLSGAAVGAFSTTDVDAGDSFTYSLVNPGGACSGADNAFFSLSGSALQTAAVLDYEADNSYTICVRSTDRGGTGLIFDQQFTIQVQDVNDAPADISLSSTHLDENEDAGTTIGAFSATDEDLGQTYTYTFDDIEGTCDGADNGSFGISGSSLTAGAPFDYETKSSFSICVRATDNGSPAKSYARPFTIQVDDVNEAPTAIALSNNVVAENSLAGTAVGDLTATDSEGSAGLVYSLVNPGGACSGADNASFSISGNQLQTAASFDYETDNSYTVCVRATDSSAPELTFDQQFTVQVSNVNEAPTDITLSNSSVAEMQAAGAGVGDFSTTEPDAAQTHTYTLVNPGGACSGVDNDSFAISDNSLLTAEEFDREDKASYTICVRSSDNGDGSLSFDKQFTISITGVNEAPALDHALPDHNLTAGTPFSYTFPADTFSDPDGDTFAYSAALADGSALPAWLTFTAATRTFSGTPNQALTLNVRLTANDGHGESISDDFTLTIAAAAENYNPVQVKPLSHLSYSTGDSFNYAFAADTFTDRDGDTLSYLASLEDGSPLPGWLTFTSATRNFAGAPTLGDGGVHTIKVTALDGKGGQTSGLFEIGIDANLSPVVSQPIPDQAAARLQPWTFQFAANSFTDPDGDALTYTAGLDGGAPLPAWLSFDADTRTFSGTPPAADALNSVYDIRVIASDGDPDHSAQDVFRLTPWTYVDPSGNLPTGSQITFNNPPDNGPDATPQDTIRLLNTVDITITYDGDPVTELGGNGLQICFEIGQDESDAVDGDLSRLVIGTSHNGGPWELLPTTVAYSPLRVCAQADQFSLFDLFVTPRQAQEDDISEPTRLPDTGFAPAQVSPVPLQPDEARYSQLDGVWLEIPALELNIPVVGVPLRGGEWDVTWLWDQAGWLQGSAFPGLDGNSVLTGHVYNSDGNPGPFARLGSLGWGERVIVHVYGIEYVYEVRSADLEVSQRNLQALKHEEHPWLTLITCRGYNSESDSYRWRTVVRAVLIEVK
jgi:LPXTG-site transpeptidase (sortase) family protein